MEVRGVWSVREGVVFFFACADHMVDHVRIMYGYGREGGGMYGVDVVGGGGWQTSFAFEQTFGAGECRWLLSALSATVEGGRLLVGYKVWGMVWGDPNVCAAAPSFAFPVRDDGTVEENGWGYIAMRGFRNPEWVPTRFAPPDHHQSSEGTGRIGFRVLWPGYGDMATVYVRVEGMEDLRVLKDVVTEAMYGADGEES